VQQAGNLVGAAGKRWMLSHPGGGSVMAGSRRIDTGIYDAEDLALMQGAIEAVCTELGIQSTDHARREAVAGRVMRTWRNGARMPLNLVHAGLDCNI